MSKASKNAGAILAVLLLALLIVGVVFVIKVAYVDEPKMTEQYVELTADTAPSVVETLPPKDTRIELFETSDIHGYIVDTTSGEPKSFQYRLAYIAGIVDEAREDEDIDDVILVDGGDIYQGLPISDLNDGATLRAAFDIMGYDAVTLGEHDFDWDVEKFATDTYSTLPAYEVGTYTGDPNIPVIAATLCYSNNHNRTLCTKDYVIVEKAGYHIALIGYVPDYLNDMASSKSEPYEIHDDLSEFSARIKEINESERPDVTIVVAHDDPVRVADALNHDDVDLVTGGRDHAGISGISESGIPYIQAAERAQGYASATIVIDYNGNVTIEDPEYTSIIEEPGLLYDTLSNSGNFNSDILALSHAAWDSIGEKMKEALGYIDTSISTEADIGGPTTSCGNFVTGLMLEYSKNENVVAAFCSLDGVNISYEVADGEIYEISAGNIYTIAPYNSHLLIYDLTGEELAKLIADGLKDSAYGDQVSGLKYQYYNHGTQDDPDIEIESITLSNGTSVDIHGTSAKYRIVITEYCASQAGSVFEGKTPLHPVTEAPYDNRAMISVLRDRRDKGNVHIPTDSGSRGTWLNADDETHDTDTTDTTDTDGEGQTE